MSKRDQSARLSPFMPPAPVATFVGREKDLQALHKIIQTRKRGAITGVVGTGGIGKTELAKRYAQKHRGDYPGGVFWASMKGGDWRTEASKILAALRPGAEPAVFPDEGKAKDEVMKVLALKGALLIIDNVEGPDQIIEPGCHVLVTTRRKDAFSILPRKAIQELPGLSKDEGVKLLEEIVGANRVGQDLAAAERIVELLGGMPLAVEIAAKHLADAPDLAFTNYIGLVQFKVRELKLEDVADKDVVASLELSLDQLRKAKDGKKLAALFEAASVCATAGFSTRTLGATASLRENDTALSRLAGRLHNRSLLEFNPEKKRYSMHPLVRQLAEARLHRDPDRERRFRENHCLYWLDYARTHATDPDKLIAEEDGLWQAMVQANQLGRAEELLPQFIEQLVRPYKGYLTNKEYEQAFRYLVSTNLMNIDLLGQTKTLVSLLEPLLQKRASLKEPSQGGLLNSLGLAYADLGDYRQAMGLYEQALEIARQIGDVQGEGIALGNMGLAHANLGDYQQAIRLYEQQLEITRRIGDVQGEGNALGNMGLAHAALGDYRKAIGLYEQHLEIARRIGDVQGEGNALGNTGFAYMHLGDYRRAIGLYEKCLEINRRIGDARGEGATLGNMGSAYMLLGDYRKAIGLYKQHLEIARRIGDVRGEGTALGNMGSAYMQLGDYRKAIGLHEQALAIDRRIGAALSEAEDLGNMGLTYTRLGDKGKARECLEAARAIFERLGVEHLIKKTERIIEVLGLKAG